ncbi:hypothetical protein [Pseudomonas mosselii]|uniref:hypothetical protein n=1 Tax=Pseudomonas mosselii TaxID=78327 RepID=UPI0011B735B6|nr:hypothetical protein [Pseudomonas mosselii]
MKYMAYGVAALLSMALAVSSYAQVPPKASVSSGAESVGTVVIYDRQQARSCSLQPVAGANKEFKFGSGTTCPALPNDEAYFFRFDGVPSAVLVTFYDSGECKDDGNFAFQVRTTQNPTTIDITSLSDVHGKPDGEIFAPGAKLMWKKGTGQVDGKLSCVRIEY